MNIKHRGSTRPKVHSLQRLIKLTKQNLMGIIKEKQNRGTNTNRNDKEKKHEYKCSKDLRKDYKRMHLKTNVMNKSLQKQTYSN